jgi:hypothetical protein
VPSSPGAGEVRRGPARLGVVLAWTLAASGCASIVGIEEQTFDKGDGDDGRVESDAAGGRDAKHDSGSGDGRSRNDGSVSGDGNSRDSVDAAVSADDSPSTQDAQGITDATMSDAIVRDAPAGTDGSGAEATTGTTGTSTGTTGSTTGTTTAGTIGNTTGATTTTGTTTATTTTGTTTTGTTTGTGTCAALLGQCGGMGWSGPTCCAAGTCTTSAGNLYYSQCTP